MNKKEQHDETKQETPAVDDVDLGDIESLDDDKFQDVTWYVYRLRDGQDPRKDLSGNGSFVAKIHGALDLERLRDAIGGGRFRLFGRGSRGSNVGPIRRVVEIEGPVKTYGARRTPKQDDAKRPAVANRRRYEDDDEDREDREDERFAFLAEQVRLLAEKLEKAQAPAPPPPFGVSQIAELVSLARTLAPPPPTEPVIAALTKGIEIGRETAGEGESDGLAGMVKSFAPALLALVNRVPPTPAPATATRMPRQPAPATVPASDTSGEQKARPDASSSDSEAVVLEEPTAHPDGIVMLAQIIGHGMTKGTPPENVADAIVDLTDDDQLQQLVALGPAALLTWARNNGLSKRVPELDSADMPKYLEAVFNSFDLDD